MQVSQQPYVTVYQVLDGVCFGTSIPAGTRGSIYLALDQLRAHHAPAEHVRTAEGIAVAIHRLEGAVRNGDKAEEQALREKLQYLGAAWQQTPIPRPSH